jgi:uncharacterized glyoxalase superfamily protein PhnB
VAHHAAGLVRLTKNPALALALKTDYTTAEVTPRQRAMLDYAVKLTRTPGAVREADLDPLRAHGLSDRDILDVNQVVAYFAFVNRIADGLGVTTDDYAETENAAIDAIAPKAAAAPVLRVAVPLLHVTDSKRADAFYCGQLGFALDFVNRGETDDPCYFGVSRDGVALHLSSHADDSVPGAAVNLLVASVDALHREFAARGVPIAMPPTDQTWGNRELYLRDPDHNALRFIQTQRD